MNEEEKYQSHDSESPAVPTESESVSEIRMDPGLDVPEPAQIKRVKLESGPPHGMRRQGSDGFGLIDGLAGRSSSLGFGSAPIVEAIQAAAESYLGDAASLGTFDDSDQRLVELFQKLFGESDNIRSESVLLCSSADVAVDRAIGLARRHRDNAFRTIALVDSDHGRTGMCRAASGRPELSANFGPMMAGFDHVSAGDFDAVRNAIRDQVACVLLSPINFGDAARPLEADFLIGVRELCDQHGVLLIIDESRVAFGAAGQPLTFASIADVPADMVILSAGLFAGLPGGLIVGTEHATGQSQSDAASLPLQAAVAKATLTELDDQQLFESCGDAMHQFAMAVAEVLGDFQFIRDVNVTGMTLGIESDVMSDELVSAASRQGLRIESAGDTAFRLQPPLVVNEQDQEHLLTMMRQTMETVERTTASFGI